MEQDKSMTFFYLVMIKYFETVNLVKFKIQFNLMLIILSTTGTFDQFQFI